MAVTNTILTSSLAQAYASAQALQAQSAQSSASQNSGNAFGNAVNVSLSPAAQTIATSQNGSSATAPPANGSTNTARAPAPHAHKAHVPVTTASTTIDTATLVEEALQQVIPKVGVANASEVVDSNGNINQVKLQELIDQQNQVQPAAT